MSMFQYVKEMRLDAVIQAGKTFGDGGRQVYRAMEVAGEVMTYRMPYLEFGLDSM